jgi:hypothetical protein
VRIGGAEIAPGEFAAAVERVSESVETLNRTLDEGDAVTQFEVSTAAAFVALAAAARWKRWWVLPLGGALLGLAVLTRADLLLVPFLTAALVALVLWRRREGFGRALAAGGLIAGGAVVVLAPWTIYASSRADELVPVTQGSPSALFVGTYLPGGGTTVGMKRKLAPVVYARRPQARKTPAFELEAGYVLEVAIASRHPELNYSDAISREARKNLVRYGLKDPLDFGVMMLDKVQRMWSRYARGGARHTSPWIRGWHILLVLGAVSGLVAGLWRSRSLVLGAILLAILYSTAIHTLVVSQARYNLPLMPALLAAGVAGWFLYRPGPGVRSVRAERTRSSGSVTPDQSGTAAPSGPSAGAAERAAGAR